MNFILPVIINIGICIFLAIYVLSNDKSVVDLSEIEKNTEFKICEVDWNGTETKFIIKYKQSKNLLWHTLQEEYTGILEIIRSNVYFDNRQRAEQFLDNLNKQSSR